jgi:hypothetical protein
VPNLDADLHTRLRSQVETRAAICGQGLPWRTLAIPKCIRRAGNSDQTHSCRDRLAFGVGVRAGAVNAVRGRARPASGRLWIFSPVLRAGDGCARITACQSKRLAIYGSMPSRACCQLGSKSKAPEISVTDIISRKPFACKLGLDGRSEPIDSMAPTDAASG